MRATRFVVVGCSDIIHRVVKFALICRAFFEPFPIAKRRKKWSGCVLEYYLRECEPLMTLDLKEILFLLTLESGKLLGSWRKRTFRICYKVKITFLLNLIKKHNLLIFVLIYVLFINKREIKIELDNYPQEQLRILVANFALTEIESEDKGVAVNQTNCVNPSDSDHPIQFQFTILRSPRAPINLIRRVKCDRQICHYSRLKFPSE